MSSPDTIPPIPPGVITQLQAEINADRVRLAEKEAALKVMIQMNASASTHVIHAIEDKPQESPSPNAPLIEDNQVIDLSELGIEDQSKKRTLVDDVRDVVKRFGDQNFTVSHVQAALKRCGIDLGGKTPRSRISVAIAKLHEEGFILRTFKGSGNIPHQFRIRKEGEPSDFVGSETAQPNHQIDLLQEGKTQEEIDD